jgi:hypothetical protein
MLERHQKIAGDRHQFPGDHEEEGVVGQQHQQHAGDEQPAEQAQDRKVMLTFFISRDIAGPVQADGANGDADDQKE